MPMKWKQLATATVVVAALTYPVAGALAINPLEDTGLNATADSAGYDTGAANITQIIGNVITFIISLLGILLMILFFYSGYEWMTAGGDTKKVQAAKDRLKNATIGLVIILGAYALSSFVLSTLINATSANP